MDFHPTSTRIRSNERWAHEAHLQFAIQNLSHRHPVTLPPLNAGLVRRDESLDGPSSATDEEPIDARECGDSPSVVRVDAATVQDWILGSRLSEQLLQPGP